MNREIKFRAWDGVDHMSGPFTLHDIVMRRVEFTSDAVVMQYTGLKDMDGKEVYEGDVVEKSNGDRLWRGVIEMSEGQWTINYASAARTALRAHYQVIEVIGNKWEHPELLTP